MEDMRFFLNKYVKSTDLSIDDIADACKISRAKFYRLMKEPERFEEKSLEKIAEILNFNSYQKKRLFSFKMINENEPNPTEKLIENILFSESPIVKNENLLEFDYYDKDIQGVYKWTASTIAKQIYSGFYNEREEDIKKRYPNRNNFEFHHNLTVTIYNSESSDSLARLARLFFALENEMQKNSSHSHHIQVSHFVEEKSGTLEDKLDFLKTITPLMSVLGDYNFYPLKLERPVWIRNNDFCVIKYSMKLKNSDHPEDKGYRYFLLNLSNYGKAYVTALYDKHLYHFFTIDTRGFTQGTLFGSTALELNMKIYKLCATYSKILLHYDFCFDNFDTSFWREVLYAAPSGSSLEQTIVDLIDPEKVYSDMENKQIIGNTLDYLEARYNECNRLGSINIFYAVGIKEFAIKRMISDFYASSVSGTLMFSKDTVIAQLEYLKDHLGYTEKGQKHFLIKPQFGTFEGSPKAPSFLVFKNGSLSISSFDSHHKNDTRTFYEDKESVNAIFSYITDSLIAKRGSIDSILMSDEDARAYVDKLLDELQSGQKQ